MNQLKQKLAVASCLIAVPFALFADEVTLSSPDGKTSITGELLSFDDTTYVLDTSIGELRLSRVWTICEGEACPEPIAELELAILANGPETNSLLQDLINGFASTQDLIGSPVVDATGAASSIELLDSAGTEIEGNVDITVQAIGTGFEELRNGAADLYLSTTAVPAEIADQAVLAGQPDPRGQGRERVIALDALVPIVHPSNPVRAVSLDELSQIAAGRIKNWSEVGGNDAPIRMLLPAEGSTLAATFGELVLEPNRVRLRRTSERAENEIQAVAAVVADVNAITITSRSGSGAAEVLPIRQSCGPLAYASDFAIKAEEYPLSQRVYTYTSGAAQTSFKTDFLEYMSSEGAQTLIEGAGYVDQTIELQPISVQGTRLTSAILSAGSGVGLELVQKFAQDLTSADRLSTTFRFTSASSELDSKSQSDVERMVAYLNTEEARNREILVIGFSDNVGRFDLNERLALLRATSVRDALVAASGGDGLTARIAISAYGPLAPVGCNDSANGRESNRRVEIWMR
jgi:phosphate transport system substrate-binding protein